eukprot:TRINITY_DN7524_c0_g1_i1.p1 TRINITY_DN7524_c0_g1~~TRINITY_DN7524_c0_g1_i1.p1  ORF type:complete len:270 (+),score=51.01 TRINITY_DN7524_c0_g1_i1:186-995(+)
MAGAARLIQKEYTNLTKNPSPYLQVYDLEEDIFKWTVFIIAPNESPYEKGIFKALIRFPDTYPMDPPSVQFVSDIFHPNIYRDGKVCMSTLQNPAPAHLEANSDPLMNWRPVLGIEQIIVSLISMLADPNCEDPANRDVAELCLKDNAAYLAKAKESAAKSLEELPEDFIVIPPFTSPPVNETHAERPEMMEMSWQGSDNSESDEGIVEFSDAEVSDCSSDESDDESTPCGDSTCHSSTNGADAEERQQVITDSDAAFALQLQNELDGK